MILCFDLGNTRWKWALYECKEELNSLHRNFRMPEPVRHGVWSKSDLSVSDKFFEVVGGENQKNSASDGVNLSLSLLRELLLDVLKISGGDISEVLVSSVADESAQQMLSQACRDVFNVNAHVAKVHLQCAGVTVAYQNPASLGVDRWLAFMAAWSKYQENCVVVDVGSAVTADYISADGEHAGGLIAPGLSLMEKVLFERTAKVKPKDLNFPTDWSPQSDTLACVAHGLAAMLTGFIRQVESKYERFILVATGGDAELAAKFATKPVVVDPYLVFEGLLFYRSALLLKG